MKRQQCWLLVVTSAILAISGCGRSSAPVPGRVPCNETPAQDRWPGVYAKARGEKDIWLVDNGGAHGPGAERKVGWRVVGAVDRIDVKAQRLGGRETFDMAVTGRVGPNGQDDYPKFTDSVSYLTFPSAGCWELSLKAGDKSEKITINVR